MKQPHKHAEIIKAWADGAEIEVWNVDAEQWEFNRSPLWVLGCRYRIKPEPKPDVVDVVRLSYSAFVHIDYDDPANIRLTFDGETGKLKKAEVLE